MNFFKSFILISLFSLITLAGCSNRHDVKVTEVFKTNILDDDAKMFSFSIVFVNQDRTNKKGSPDGQQRQKQGKGNKPQRGSSNTKVKLENQMTEELEERLVEKLEETGYCRKGYFELERTLNRSVYTIKGECSESATTEDRTTFINK